MARLILLVLALVGCGAYLAIDDGLRTALLLRLDLASKSPIISVEAMDSRIEYGANSGDPFMQGRLGASQIAWSAKMGLNSSIGLRLAFWASKSGVPSVEGAWEVSTPTQDRYGRPAGLRLTNDPLLLSAVAMGEPQAVIELEDMLRGADSCSETNPAWYDSVLPSEETLAKNAPEAVLARYPVAELAGLQGTSSGVARMAKMEEEYLAALAIVRTREVGPCDNLSKPG